MTNPMLSRRVSISPNTVTPKNMAVTGSSAPRMAVGVEPIYWMALVVHRNDTAVGKTARASKFPHKYHWSGTHKLPDIPRRTTNSDNPNNST